MANVKMVIVVRKDLHMRKGKIAAQVAHASMAVLLKRMQVHVYHSDLGNGEVYAGQNRTLHLEYGSPMWEWLNGSFTKIVLYVEFEDAIMALANRCHFMAIPHAVITDAGRTEFHGEPTITCIAIGPDEADKIDEITGDLPLL